MTFMIFANLIHHWYFGANQAMCSLTISIGHIGNVINIVLITSSIGGRLLSLSQMHLVQFYRDLQAAV